MMQSTSQHSSRPHVKIRPTPRVIILAKHSNRSLDEAFFLRSMMDRPEEAVIDSGAASFVDKYFWAK